MNNYFIDLIVQISIYFLIRVIRGSGVRSQELGVRSQESGVRS
ncbi:MAG: hypothetical protein AAFX80_07490 [Cyanobacteria bacterium J06639_18]